jgi:hypothetical protein
MRPLTMITGILLGSCLAIFVSLAMVLIVFLVLGDDHPRLQHEFRPLLISSSWCSATITRACSMSFGPF